MTTTWRTHQPARGPLAQTTVVTVVNEVAVALVVMALVTTLTQTMNWRRVMER